MSTHDISEISLARQAGTDHTLVRVTHNDGCWITFKSDDRMTHLFNYDVCFMYADFGHDAIDARLAAERFWLGRNR